MNFYTLDYITKTQSTGLIIRSAVIIVLLAVVILTSFKFMKDRMKTRLRDISIGIVVLTFILLGIQVEHYTQNNRDFSQSHVLLKFIESFSLQCYGKLHYIKGRNNSKVQWRRLYGSFERRQQLIYIGTYTYNQPQCVCRRREIV